MRDGGRCGSSWGRRGSVGVGGGGDGSGRSRVSNGEGNSGRRNCQGM